MARRNPGVLYPKHQIRFTVCKRANPAFPTTFEHIGDYLRAERLRQGITQRGLANLLEIDNNTLFDWEIGLAKPLIIQYPKIIAFLGNDPLFNNPESLAGQVRHFRRMKGMTRKELADLTGVNTHTLGRFEQGGRSYGRTIKTLAKEGFAAAQIASQSKLLSPASSSCDIP